MDTNKPSDKLRDRLLAQQAPPAANRFAAYRKEIQAMLEQTEIRLRREKWFTMAVWLFMVATSVAFMVAGGRRADSPRGTWFGILATFWFLYGAVELLKHFINRARVDLLKEIKKLEMQILELREGAEEKR